MPVLRSAARRAREAQETPAAEAEAPAPPPAARRRRTPRRKEAGAVREEAAAAAAEEERKEEAAAEEIKPAEVPAERAAGEEPMDGQDSADKQTLEDTSPIPDMVGEMFLLCFACACFAWIPCTHTILRLTLFSEIILN
jgi:hypothetical protein